MDFKVEFMVNSHNGFLGLNNNDDFLRLLCTKSTKLIIKRGTVSCGKGFVCNLKIIVLELPGDDRCFHLCIHKKISKEKIENAGLIIDEIRRVIGQLGFRVDMLHDDLSHHYSCLIYSEINLIENKLRHLITYIMYKAHGSNWASVKVPKAFKEDLQKKQKCGDSDGNKGRDNILQNANFETLSSFLFDSYRGMSCDLVDKLLVDYQRSASVETADHTINKLLDFIPRSHWNQSFQDIVEGMNEEQIKYQWERLKTLRNLIAHNREFTRRNYDEALDLISAFNRIFDDSIDKIKTPDFTSLGIKKADEDFDGIIKDKSMNILSMRRTMNGLIEDYCVFIGLPVSIESYLGRSRHPIEFRKSAGELIDVMHDYKVVDEVEYEKLKKAESMIIVEESIVSDDDDYGMILGLMSESIELIRSLFDLSFKRKVVVVSEPILNTDLRRVARVVCDDVEVMNEELVNITYLIDNESEVEEVIKKIQLHLHVPSENINLI
ncbi:MAG: hypothetical protein Q7T36_00205 [Fluviicoccus sp.]|uniref:hypothetical protein n=1 Tax=Fluviicoccus sp. TaxID=2003552 RepID=UPI00271E8557|nr:hypothetical protein [Fluviicoccus sp.]MDO8328878.1 hypothetical protein [Fluviicoccus sp.]